MNPQDNQPVPPQPQPTVDPNQPPVPPQPQVAPPAEPQVIAPSPEIAPQPQVIQPVQSEATQMPEPVGVEQNPPISPAPSPTEPSPQVIAPQSPVPQETPVAPQPQPIADPMQQASTPNQPPVPPTQPIQPVVGGQPPVAPQPQGGMPAFHPITGSGMKGDKRKLFVLGGSIAAAVAVIAILIVAVLPMIGGVSKADYVKAGDEMNDVASAYSGLGTAYVSTFSTATETKNDLDTLRTKKEAFNKELEELGDTKAVKRDKDLKEKYAAVIKAKPEFDKALDSMEESYTLIMPILLEFNEADDANRDIPVATISALKKKFEEAANSAKAEHNKQYLQSMAASMGKLETLTPQVLAGRADYRKYDSNVTKQYYDVSTEISKASRDWTSNIQKLSDDAELQDELSSFRSSLTSKLLTKE